MNWFTKVISVLILLATASTFFLTATQMNNNVFTFTQEVTSVASVVESQRHSDFIETAAATSTTQTNLPSKDEVTVPDTILTGSPNTKDAPTGIEASYEYKLHDVVSGIHSRSNLARSQNNLPPLTHDPILADLAKARSEDMVKRDYFSHIAPDGCDLACRFKSARYASLTWGENLATFSEYTTLNETALAASFINDWLESSTHRQNILSTNFTHEGIGVAVQGNKIIVTVLFARP